MTSLKTDKKAYTAANEASGDMGMFGTKVVINKTLRMVVKKLPHNKSACRRVSSFLAFVCELTNILNFAIFFSF